MQKSSFFFERFGLTQADVERYLAAALSAGGEYADLYFEYLTTTSLNVDESLVKSASQGISAGCGVRVISGERTGYAYTDDLAPEKILHAARTAALIASGPAKQPVLSLKEHNGRNLYPIAVAPTNAEISEKLELVQRADKAARAYDARIREVRVSYADELRQILVIGSDGSFASDTQPLARMSVMC
ncbi:MAG: PmbA/TldA family metallopeptidase, partial [Burkholderiales bacterium]